MKRVSVVCALLVAAATTMDAQNRKEFKYTAAPGASLTIVNEFGPVTLKPAGGRQVVIVATLHSDKVEIDSSQTGNRIEARTHLLEKVSEQEGRVDYEVSVPANLSVVVRAATGPIEVQKLQSDLTLKGDTARVNVRELANVNVNVQTVSGPIELANVGGGNVEVMSTDGAVNLTAVSGANVRVNSASGNITYDGDFGSSGRYSLTNHSGNIDVTLPSTASFDLMARSMTGSVQNDFSLQKKSHGLKLVEDGRSSIGTSNTGACSVQLRSFSGKIRVKKR